MADIIHLEDQVLMIRGATRVVSSTQAQAVVETNEKSIIVTGNEIEVKKLNLDEQEVWLAGKFSIIKFAALGGKKQSLLKRIFK